MTNDPNIPNPFTAIVHCSVAWEGDVYEVRAHSSGRLFAISSNVTVDDRASGA